MMGYAMGNMIRDLVVLRTLEQRHLVFFVWTNCAALATFKVRNRTSTGLDIHALVLGEHFAGHPPFLLTQTGSTEQVFAGNLVLMCELMHISEITDLRCWTLCKKAMFFAKKHFCFHFRGLLLSIFPSRSAVNTRHLWRPGPLCWTASHLHQRHLGRAEVVPQNLNALRVQNWYCYRSTSISFPIKKRECLDDFVHGSSWIPLFQEMSMTPVWYIPLGIFNPHAFCHLKSPTCFPQATAPCLWASRWTTSARNPSRFRCSWPPSGSAKLSPWRGGSAKKGRISGHGARTLGEVGGWDWLWKMGWEWLSYFFLIYVGGRKERSNPSFWWYSDTVIAGFYADTWNICAPHPAIESLWTGRIELYILEEFSAHMPIIQQIKSDRIPSNFPMHGCFP